MQTKPLIIFNHFGLENQLKKLKEEVDELIEAIHENDHEHIHEEYADVMLLMGQLYQGLGLETSKIDEWILHKIDRTLTRYNIGQNTSTNGNIST